MSKICKAVVRKVSCLCFGQRPKNKKKCEEFGLILKKQKRTSKQTNKQKREK